MRPASSDDTDADDGMPSSILRSTIVVTPHLPFWRWAASCPSASPGMQVWRSAPSDEQAVVFLVHAIGHAGTASYLEREHDRLFVAMLTFCTQTTEHWPTDRSLAMFREWFGVAHHGMPYDVVGRLVEDRPGQ